MLCPECTLLALLLMRYVYIFKRTGGTVCSPTRATGEQSLVNHGDYLHFISLDLVPLFLLALCSVVLTGRNHFRDCVNYVYGCSDMTECVPRFKVKPNPNTMTECVPRFKVKPNPNTMTPPSWC